MFQKNFQLTKFITFITSKKYLFFLKLQHNNNLYPIMLFRKYHKIQDYNFNYFHQNQNYKSTFFQIFKPSETLSQKNSSTKFDGRNILSEEYISNLDTEEIVKTMEQLSNTCIGSIRETDFKVLDEKCSDFIENWSLEKTLYIFDMWFLILQQKAFSTRYFYLAQNLWFNNFELLTAQNIMQILYYLGLNKNVSNQQVTKQLKIIEEKHYDMTDIEIAILCLCFFKLRIKHIPQKIIFSSIKVAQNFILRNDRFHLISILKFLRQIEVYDDKLYHLLGNFIIANYNSFNFVECTNFLATYSSALVYDENVFDVLEKQSTLLLKNEKLDHFEDKTVRTHPSLRSRVKDISRYLWAMVWVGYNLKVTTIETVLEIVRKRFLNEEYKNQSHILIDCLHSFALLNVYPEDLLKHVFTSEVLNNLLLEKKRKPLHQLYFLTESLKIDRLNLFTSLQLSENLCYLKPRFKNFNQQIQSREHLMNIFNLIKTSNIPGSSVKFNYSLQHFRILNIEMNLNSLPFNSRKIFCIEILDSTVCCRNSEKPIGLLNAKLRHLNSLNYSVIILTEHDIHKINGMSEVEKLQKINELLSML